MHEVLVNGLFKLAQDKVWLGELTVPPRPQLLTWDLKQQTQTNRYVTWCPTKLAQLIIGRLSHSLQKGHVIYVEKILKLNFGNILSQSHSLDIFNFIRQ